MCLFLAFQELQLAKQEMNYQCDHLKECLRRKESELTQLKQQAQTSSNTSQTSNGSAELESRIRSLATSLIQKQGALEALIAERNSLRLKLERFEVCIIIGIIYHFLSYFFHMPLMLGTLILKLESDGANISDAKHISIQWRHSS